MAYIHALATSVGITVDRLSRDINGCDVLLRAQDTASADAEQLSIQLKCTVNRLRRIEGGRSLAFDLDRKDYRHLIKSQTHPPRILVVVEVPHHSPQHWVRAASSELLVYASAWYVKLTDEPDIPDAQERKTIRLPGTQQFSAAALLANMRSCP